MDNTKDRSEVNKANRAKAEKRSVRRRTEWTAAYKTLYGKLPEADGHDMSTASWTPESLGDRHKELLVIVDAMRHGAKAGAKLNNVFPVAALAERANAVLEDLLAEKVEA